MSIVKDGIYPAMITPYKKDGSVDLEACKALVKWYADRGCDGIFADCMSNEIFFLSLEERVAIAKTVLEAAEGTGLDIVISGHISDSLEDQITELKAMAELKPKAIVLITNRLAAEDEPDEVLVANAKAILEAIPDIDFGLYEAPAPYKRELNPDVLKALIATDRFVFMKDTCCEAEKIKEKVEAIKDSRLKLYNANSATLLESLYDGAAGYCGVMTSFHPELYARLMELYKVNKEEAEKLQNYIGYASAIQYQMYPLNAKYYLQKHGLPIESTFCRNRSSEILNETMRKELDQMYETEKLLGEMYCG